jgi:hypothetical protein
MKVAAETKYAKMLPQLFILVLQYLAVGGNATGNTYQQCDTAEFQYYK